MANLLSRLPASARAPYHLFSTQQLEASFKSVTSTTNPLCPPLLRITVRINPTSYYAWETPRCLVSACLPDLATHHSGLHSPCSGLVGLCLSHTQSWFLPQGLCTCSLCLKFSSPDSLIHQVSAQMSSHRPEQLDLYRESSYPAGSF